VGSPDSALWPLASDSLTSPLRGRTRSHGGFAEIGDVARGARTSISQPAERNKTHAIHRVEHVASLLTLSPRRQPRHAHPRRCRSRKSSSSLLWCTQFEAVRQKNRQEPGRPTAYGSAARSSNSLISLMIGAGGGH